MCIMCITIATQLQIVFQVPLGLIFKNENANEDMIEILQQFHDYLPQTHNGGIDGQLFSGDQLTIERAVNIISSVANGYTPKDRLEGINLQLGDWHAAVKLLSVSKTILKLSTHLFYKLHLSQKILLFVMLSTIGLLLIHHRQYFIVLY